MRIILWLAIAIHAFASDICGTKGVTPRGDEYWVVCVDYDAWRKIAPEIPWPQGKATQVLTHHKSGDAVRVAVGGEVKFSDIMDDAYGRRVSMVQFKGVGHESLDIQVFAKQ